jgi:hypothetical protein
MSHSSSLSHRWEATVHMTMSFILPKLPVGSYSTPPTSTKDISKVAPQLSSICNTSPSGQGFEKRSKQWSSTDSARCVSLVTNLFPGPGNFSQRLHFCKYEISPIRRGWGRVINILPPYAPPEVRSRGHPPLKQLKWDF